jgi:enolase-phosphatase E1
MTRQYLSVRVGAVVLDIEGTTGSISHVRDVLFPYARKRIASWMRENRSSTEHLGIMHSLRDLTGTADLSEEAAITVLHGWADHDVKAAPLKTLQGWIWARGYATGELSGHVYPDVPEALSRWEEQGIACYIYSSGSESAQREWFSHTAYGDLTRRLSGYYDLTSAGPKFEPLSYETISTNIGMPGKQILFASDVAEELNGARDAGWHTVAVRRQDDERGADVPGHPVITSFDDLHLDVSAE